MSAIIAGGIILLAGFVLLWKLVRSRVIVFLASVPLGLLVYCVLGITFARLLKHGRFYSVPFGGFRIGGDVYLIGSGIFWILVSMLILDSLYKRRKSARD